MVSIIVCSINDARFSSVAANYTQLLKDEPHEIIRIADARSLCEGYTRGVAQSRGEYLIFSHDDIEILSADFAVRLKEHLNEFDLVGVAGTNRLVRGTWIAAGPPYIFGQVAQQHLQEGFVVRIFGGGRRAFGGIHAMDGVFLAARRAVAEQIPFDARTFDGFHHYDLDFTFAAHLAGLRLGIASDIHILHASWGVEPQDEKWRHYLARFEQKYAGRLHPMPLRPWVHATVKVATKEEIVEVMSGGYSV
jgi:GT2 family glycosyltransferase